MGEGFSGRVLPGSDQTDGAGAGRGGAGRGGIDISLAVGKDHIFEVLGGNFAIFSKQGKKYKETGKLLYGPATNNTIFAGGCVLVHESHKHRHRVCSCGGLGKGVSDLHIWGPDWIAHRVHTGN